MPDVGKQLTAAMGKVNDALNRVFLGGTTSAVLLKASATLDAFEEIVELDSGWFFEYSETRQQFKLRVAKDADDVTFTAEVQQATHVRINDDVYVINQADTLPPLGTSPEWSIFCTRFTEPGRQFRSLY